MPAFALEEVRHRYGRFTVLDGFNLSVSSGELVCLLGPSGCGKTTVLRLAAGLTRLQEGRITLGDSVISGPGIHWSPERRSMGLVFQDFALFPHLSIFANVAFGLRGLSRSKLRARVFSYLDRVGLSSVHDCYPHELSGGEQQRVALARALAPEPRILLLDEPFSDLNPNLRMEVRDKALHLLKASGTVSLLITHDAEEAMFMADRIALMHRGKIVQEGEPMALYFKPESAFAASFFGGANRLYSSVRGGFVETPMGRLVATGYQEGQPVSVLIRPEGLKLRALSPFERGRRQGCARVLTARLVGRNVLVHLETLERMSHSAGSVHLHARIAGSYLPREGDIFKVDLDVNRVFVFPCAEDCGREEGCGKR